MPAPFVGSASEPPNDDRQLAPEARAASLRPNSAGRERFAGVTPGGCGCRDGLGAGALLAYAFEDQRLHRVTANCLTTNEPSFRLMNAPRRPYATEPQMERHLAG